MLQIYETPCLMVFNEIYLLQQKYCKWLVTKKEQKKSRISVLIDLKRALFQRHLASKRERKKDYYEW